LPKSEEKILDVEECAGTGSSWPRNYAEICILVAKYISKMTKIQITCHVFNYVFQILVFQLLDNSANKHAEQTKFSSVLPAAHAFQLNTQN